jgi:hypothetical protein
MKHRILSLKEARSLVWRTWFGIIAAGAIVYACTNPESNYMLLAGLVILVSLLNFWVKSRYIQKRNYRVVPTVFLPTVFFAAISALAMIKISGDMLNSWSLGLATICVACLIAVYPENKYAYPDETATA